jgi:hypothetical protein
MIRKMFPMLQLKLKDHIDYSRVQKLGGKRMQYRLDDYARTLHIINELLQNL